MPWDPIVSWVGNGLGVLLANPGLIALFVVLAIVTIMMNKKFGILTIVVMILVVLPILARYGPPILVESAAVGIDDGNRRGDHLKSVVRKAGETNAYVTATPRAAATPAAPGYTPAAPGYTPAAPGYTPAAPPGPTPYVAPTPACFPVLLEARLLPACWKEGWQKKTILSEERPPVWLDAEGGVESLIPEGVECTMTIHKGLGVLATNTYYITCPPMGLDMQLLKKGMGEAFEKVAQAGTRIVEGTGSWPGECVQTLCTPTPAPPTPTPAPPTPTATATPRPGEAPAAPSPTPASAAAPASSCPATASPGTICGGCYYTGGPPWCSSAGWVVQGSCTPCTPQ